MQNFCIWFVKLQCQSSDQLKAWIWQTCNSQILFDQDACLFISWLTVSNYAAAVSANITAISLIASYIFKFLWLWNSLASYSCRLRYFILSNWFRRVVTNCNKLYVNCMLMKNNIAVERHPGDSEALSGAGHIQQQQCRIRKLQKGQLWSWKRSDTNCQPCPGGGRTRLQIWDWSVRRSWALALWRLQKVSVWLNMCVLPICGSFEFAMWMLAEIDVLLAVHNCLLKTEHCHNMLPLT